MVIIGKGMIARAISQLDLQGDVVVMASGVSNSNEENEDEFAREVRLLESVLDNLAGRKIVYFSTCSVYQKHQTAYVRHKLRVESLIKMSNVSYVIFRLPQVVGCVSNNTLVSYLVRKIMSGDMIFLQRYARRNLVDVEDVATALKEYLDISKDIHGEVLDIAMPSSIPIRAIANEIGEILGKSVHAEFVETGSNYNIFPHRFLDFYSRSEIVSEPNYWRWVLRKYVPRIAPLC